jgi:hypothetical protein
MQPAVSLLGIWKFRKLHHQICSIFQVAYGDYFVVHYRCNALKVLRHGVGSSERQQPGEKKSSQRTNVQQGHLARLPTVSVGPLVGWHCLIVIFRI